MKSITRVVLACLSAFVLASGQDAQAQSPATPRTGLPLVGGAVVTTEQVRAELVAHAPEGLAAGKPAWLGLKLEHQPGWHTYWKNPGDSGLPTTLQWTLPAQASTDEIAWPTPKKLPVGPLMNYGYEATLLLPVALSVPAGFTQPALDVQLLAQWLVCKDVCIPQEGEFVLRVPTQAATALHGALFDAALKAQPQVVRSTAAVASVDAKNLTVKITGLPEAWQGKPLELLSEVAGVVNHAAKATSAWQGAAWQTDVPLSPERFESPARMDAVLITPGVAQGIRLSFDVKGTWPALAGPATVTSTTVLSVNREGAAPLSGSGPSMSLVAALLSALLGGLLLNLMPCVLPVLSLKVLGLTQHSASAGDRLGSGVAYTAGVIASFLALAAVLLVLRAGGEAVGWGFQLQSPWVVAVLALLFTLIGLNLAGVFEVSTLVPSGLASLRASHPWLDAALTGMLAVAVAAPCTAPFMGAALGFAVGLPTAEAMLVFAALGFGLALPFLAASLVPGIARWLPKPGAWMERFKVAMAFPMFATVVWLVWVLGQQAGIDGAAALLALLVATAFAVWALALRGRTGKRSLGLSALALAALVGVAAWVAPLIKTSDAPQQANTAAASSEGWQAWSPQRVAEHRAAGRTVFVDFTAAWCVTCQVNKRSTLGDAAVLAAFDKQGVVTMRADWTRRDATIAAEIARLGRSGVPVYVVYRAADAAPTVLPEVLSPSMVINAVTSDR